MAEAMPIGLMLILYAFLGFIYLYGGAEAIHLLLDIEANTRHSAERLERLTPQVGPPVLPAA